VSGRGLSRSARALGPRGAGFTLIELLVALALVGVLAALAVPGYGTYAARSRVIDAAMRLSDQRAKMEQFFLDHRTYVDGAGACGAGLPASVAPADAFVVTCAATTSTYVVTATGQPAAGMTGFTLSIDETGARATASVPAGWRRTADCWTGRPDGSCL